MKPILFNTEMVRAILEGRKTVTRRVVKTKHKDACGFYVTTRKSDGAFMGVYEYDENESMFDNPLEPPYQVNDVLYVRETWKPAGKGKKYFYKVDWEMDGIAGITKWKPSIHMPKEAARIFLRVTDVRVERLQDITEEQAKAEGVVRLYDDLSDEDYIDWTKRTGLYPKEKGEWGYLNYLWYGLFGKYGSGNYMSDRWEYQRSSYDTAVGSFSSLWESTIKKGQIERYGWEANPYVWVIEFEVISKDEALEGSSPVV